MRQLPDAELAADAEQLLHPVSAGMAAQHGTITVLRDLLRECRILQQTPEVLPHLPAVLRHQIIPPRSEEALAVVPRRGYERHATGERLEHPDGRDPGKLLTIEPPRHVHRHPRAGEQGRHPEVGYPAAILGPGRSQSARRLRRVAHAIDTRAQAEIAHRLEQILPELPAALAVAPVAHPDEVERLLEPRHGPEHARVRRLMPGPGAWCVL